MATNWARVSQKRQQRTEVEASQVLFWYLCLYLNVLTLYCISQANSEKRSFCKTVSKHVVNYAPSYGPPWTVLGHNRFFISHYEVAREIGPKLVSQNSSLPNLTQHRRSFKCSNLKMINNRTGLGDGGSRQSIRVEDMGRLATSLCLALNYCEGTGTELKDY